MDFLQKGNLGSLSNDRIDQLARELAYSPQLWECLQNASL